LLKTSRSASTVIDDDQFLLRIEGTAGTGKSHLINAMCHLIEQKIGDAIKVAAPTGRAANNVGGLTIHKLLQIVPNDLSYVPDLKGMALQLLQNNLKDMKYLIIDEISMVGCNFFALIDRRLRQATCRPSALFGGISLILVGDMKQLPPVADVELSASRTERSHSSNVICGMAAFDAIEDVVLLETIVRQGDPDQIAFRDLLTRLRSGQSVYEDWVLLSSRFYSTTSAQTRLDFKDATRLFSRKEKVLEYNADKLAQLNTGLSPQSTCRIDAMHTPIQHSQAAKIISSDKMMGLETTLFLARGARVMICQNVWVEKTLSNGQCGVVKHVIFSPGNGPPSIPETVIVEMDESYKGPHLAGKPRYVVFNSVTSFIKTMKGTLERTQIPLRLAFAITIHKCQGNINLM
jgi:ATP-dependent exoDNAse (exonuclease V) alpha subunit